MQTNKRDKSKAENPENHRNAKVRNTSAKSTDKREMSNRGKVENCFDFLTTRILRFNSVLRFRNQRLLAYSEPSPHVKTRNSVDAFLED